MTCNIAALLQCRTPYHAISIYCQASSSSTKLVIETVGNMEGMICLGQGGLRSSSALSSVFRSVGLFVCLFVSNIIKKSYAQIAMKFKGGVQDGTMKN